MAAAAFALGLGIRSEHKDIYYTKTSNIVNRSEAGKLIQRPIRSNTNTVL